MDEKTEKHKILKEDDESNFLTRNRISQSVWSDSKCVWSELQEIAKDHEANFSKLATTAEFIAKTVQNFSGVHSVRWRVKDTEHLIEKIIRKKSESEGGEKYKDIDKSNYNEILTDLIGVRALHLFKDDCFEIDAQLRSTWEPIETPIAYTRKGDYEDFIQKLSQHGFETTDHKAGYRSLHYVIESKPTNRAIRAEIQVRTLFEEGWSEIDHRVRYPNFSNDPLTTYLLKIFNRMAGSADEMGEFVRQLSESLGQSAAELSAAITERDNAMAEIEATVAQLEDAKDSTESYKTLTRKLKTEILSLKVSQKKREKSAKSLSEDNAARVAKLFGLGGMRPSAVVLNNSQYVHAMAGKILTAGDTVEELRNVVIPAEPRHSDEED